MKPMTLEFERKAHGYIGSFSIFSIDTTQKSIDAKKD